MSSSYELLFENKSYGFSIVHDGYSNNAAVITVSNPTYKSSLHVGSWIISINGTNVESQSFETIAKFLKDTKEPVLIKFRAYSIISGTHQQLLAHNITNNITIELSDTGKQPAQQGKDKPFVAYNLSITDGNLKWQIWKRYNQFEQLHKQLLKITPDLGAQLPPRKAFGRFKPSFIQQRSDLLQKYLTAIEQNEKVVQSQVFTDFLLPRPYQETEEQQFERKAKESIVLNDDIVEDLYENEDEKEVIISTVTTTPGSGGGAIRAVPAFGVNIQEAKQKNEVDENGFVKVHAMYIEQANQIVQMLKIKNAELERRFKQQLQANEDGAMMYSELLMTKQTLEMENIALKQQLQNMGNIRNEQKDDDDVEMKGAEKCKLKFENWLCNVVKLRQYLELFKKKQYNDITMIEFFEGDILEIEIGIENRLHRKLIMKRVDEFKGSLMEFDDFLEMNKELKYYKQRLIAYGIVTVADLRNDIAVDKDVRDILRINDEKLIGVILNCVHCGPNEGPPLIRSKTLYH